MLREIFCGQRVHDERHALGMVKYSVILPRHMGGIDDFHQARHVATSFLGKLVWIMTHDKGKLWIYVFSHSYLNNKNLLESSCPSSSPIWKAMWRAYNVLKDGFQIKLGDVSCFFSLAMSHKQKCGSKSEGSRAIG